MVRNNLLILPMLMRKHFADTMIKKKKSEKNIEP